MLSGNEDNCLIGYFKKSFLEGRKTREGLKFYLVKKKQSFLLTSIGDAWSFLWFEQCGFCGYAFMLLLCVHDCGVVLFLS